MEYLDLGVPEMDEQHQEILRTLDDLLKPEARTDEAKFLTRLRAMISVLDGHFKLEEDLMESSGYPRLDLHRKQHESIHRDAHEMLEGCLKGRKTPDDVFNVVFSWSRTHITGSDAQFAKFLKKH